MTDAADSASQRHQLRNKLNNITMNAELVKLQLQQSQPADKILLSVERVLQECKDCAALLNVDA